MLSLRTFAVLLVAVASAMAQTAPTNTLAQNVGAEPNLSELNKVGGKHVASPSSGFPPWFPEKLAC
jgi:hypothetical protein